MNIAVLDDDQAHNDLLAAMLRQAGHRCTVYERPPALLADLDRLRAELDGGFTAWRNAGAPVETEVNYIVGCETHAPSIHLEMKRIVPILEVTEQIGQVGVVHRLSRIIRNQILL